MAQEHAAQAAHDAAQATAHGGGEHAASGAFNAGETIIYHVSNSSHEHPLIHLPAIAGIDMSVTKHVFMLWLVATLLFLLVTIAVRRYLKSGRPVPTGFMNGIEAVVLFVRDEIVQPNVGRKWVNTWTPLILTFFFFILSANAIGLIPIFDVIALVDHYALHTAPDSFLKQVVHGGTTATANFNVTAALATITFASIILAGSKAHGFVKHWMNLVPHGLAWPIYILLIPIEILGMFVKPFALTMRLAANMTGGHIAILAILSFVFLFAEKFGQALPGIGVGLVMSVPLAVGISALEIIVVMVQAYVFTLLTAVFIGMAIHVHH
jgi:F-type H+-transporting ATPase subunit a